MKVFVDTSFLIALTDKSDIYYNEAQSFFKEKLGKFILRTHNMIIFETITRLRRRAGFRLTKEFGEEFRHSKLIDVKIVNIGLTKLVVSNLAPIPASITAISIFSEEKYKKAIKVVISKKLKNVFNFFSTKTILS